VAPHGIEESLHHVARRNDSDDRPFQPRQTADLEFEHYLGGFLGVVEGLTVRTFSVMALFTLVRSR
jgi:hypothetical protein